MPAKNDNRRTLRCSDDDWEKILAAAEAKNMSASAFLVGRALAPEQSADPDGLKQVAEQLRKMTDEMNAIRRGVRFIAFAVSDWYIGNGRRDLRKQRLEAAQVNPKKRGNAA